jgi:carbon-monoxide dehydrogenase large subunit
MTTTAGESRALDEIKIGGLGSSRKRVEDDRFIRGKGNYTDDVVLPGMLHMEILRSPLPHARITSIDTSKAWAIPGVHLVLTGEMMATRNLAWMPTLSYDTQAVLATDKVRFQGQEVACVIADDPYIAKDACEAIEVDYEPLPVIVNPWQGLAADAPTTRSTRTTTSSTTGRSATRRAPTAPSPRPTWSPSWNCTTRAATRRRSSAAGLSPTSTAPPRSSPCT